MYKEVTESANDSYYNELMYKVRQDAYIAGNNEC